MRLEMRPIAKPKAPIEDDSDDEGTWYQSCADYWSCNDGGASSSHDTALAATKSPEAALAAMESLPTAPAAKGNQAGETWKEDGRRVQVDGRNMPWGIEMRCPKDFNRRDWEQNPSPCSYSGHHACGKESIYFFNFSKFSNKLLGDIKPDTGNTWYQQYHDMTKKNPFAILVACEANFSLKKMIPARGPQTKFSCD